MIENPSNNSSKDLLLKVIVVTTILILLVSGFALGYVYKSIEEKGCKSNPLVYGIKEINQQNNNNFQCSCISSKGSFGFNEERVVDNIYP